MIMSRNGARDHRVFRALRFWQLSKTHQDEFRAQPRECSETALPCVCWLGGSRRVEFGVPGWYGSARHEVHYSATMVGTEEAGHPVLHETIGFSQQQKLDNPVASGILSWRDEEPSVVVVHLAADETLPDRTEVCDDFLRLLLECGFAGAPTGQADTYSDTCRNLVVWTRQFHRLKSRPINKAIEKSVKDCSVISAVHD